MSEAGWTKRMVGRGRGPGAGLRRGAITVAAALLVVLLATAPPSLDGQDGRAVAQGPAAADLVVFDIHTSNREPWSGDTVEISTIISNKGGAKASNVTVICYDSSREVSEKTIKELGPGANQEVVFKWGTGEVSLGKHTIRVLVDPEDKVAESNETNNEASVDVTVREHPLRTYAIPILLVIAVLGFAVYKLYYRWALWRLKRKGKGSGKGAGTRAKSGTGAAAARGQRERITKDEEE